MKRLTPYIVLFALLAIGCGATRTERLANADRTYTVVAKAATLAVETGAVPDDALDALALADHEAFDALAAAHRQPTTAPASDLDYWIDRAVDAVGRYAELVHK